MDDWQLLQDYAERNSETAFCALVDRYLDFVHSAALRQLRAPLLAEEVTQAVFILLARKAGSFGRTVVLPGWLFRTTRFVAARALRAEQRRQRREQEAVQMQQLSTPDETWQRIAPVLDEALERLGETDRNAVLLRFFQDKSLREVGTRLGLSEEAAKKRVVRALEKLRAFFASRGFHVSGVTLAAVLVERGVEAAPAGFAARVAAEAFVQAAAATATLSVLVREVLAAWRWAKVKLAAGFGAAAITVALLVNGLTPETPPLSDAAEVTRTARESVTAETAADAGAPAEPAPQEPPDTQRLLFRVVDVETGLGIAGASVHTRFWHDAQIDRRDDFATDFEGRCEIPLPDAELGRVDVGVLAAGYVQKFVSWYAFRGDPIPSEYVLSLERGVSIGGWVRDEAGNPVAGAEISFQFAGVGDSDSREPQRERLGFLDDLVAAKSDASGRWSCAIVPPKYGDFSLKVKHAAFTVVGYNTDADDHNYVNAQRLRMGDLWAGNAVLVLKRGLSLSGVVVDDQQNPVPGAAVELGFFSGAPQPSAKTSVDGSFLFHNVQAGEIPITATAEGFTPTRLEVHVAPETPPVNIQLNRGAVLRLRVVGEDGAGVPAALVLEDGGRNAETWRGSTDQGGRVEWDSAPKGMVRLYVGKPGYFNSRHNDVRTGSEEQTITLRKALTVSGWVVDGETKQPISGFKAIPGYGSDRPSWNRGFLRASTNGHYMLTFDELAPSFAVRIEAEGYETAVSQALPTEPSEQTCDFELKRQDDRLAVRGVVRLPDGRPAAGAEVALCTPEKGATLGRARFLFRPRFNVTEADQEGRFSFAPDRTAHTVIAVHPEGFARVRIEQLGEPVQVQLQPWGRIEGSFRVTGHPPAGQKLTLLVPTDRHSAEPLYLDLSSFSAQTDSGGNFVLELVPPGDFHLYLNEGIGKSLSCQTPVEVDPGQTTRVQIGGTGRRVVGRLVTTETNQVIDWSRQVHFAHLETKAAPFPQPAELRGEALERWTRDFWQSEEGRARFRSTRNFPLEVAADGSFRVEDVLPGAYELRAQVANSSVQREILVLESEDNSETEPLDVGTIMVGVRRAAAEK